MLNSDNKVQDNKYIKDDLPFSKETSLIIKSFYSIYNRLGFGFKSDVYKKAFVIELSNNNIQFQSELPVEIYYDSVVIGSFIADFVVCRTILLLINSSLYIQAHDEQLLYNQLRNSNLEIGFLFNFGSKPEFFRKSPNDMQNEELTDLPFDD